MRNMLEAYPEGLVACVSDSFDIWRACKDYWGDKLKDLITGRITDTKFGRLIVRPDSGDPAETCTAILKILLEQFKEDVTLTPTGQAAGCVYPCHPGRRCRLAVHSRDP